MDCDKKLEELALNLFKIDAVKFGDFTTKSGIKTPVYFDLRVIVSYPNVMESISNLLYEVTLKNSNFEHLCGVPYTALPIATLLSVKAKKSMLMRRKEAKSYGTKKVIEGHYKAGQKCFIVEDVVTSGSSVLETVRDLRNEGLIADEAVIILDREQGGKQNLESNNVKMTSLFTMSKLIDILIKNKCISEQTGTEVNSYFKNTQAPSLVPSIERIYLPFEKRAELTTNSIAKDLFNIMATKKTNLCLSIDLTTSTQIFNLLEKVGEHGNLITPEYTEATVKMAGKFPHLITGFVCQKKETFKDPGLIQLTPGVQLESSKDELGQVYNTPEKVVLDNGADVVVVGRGIVASKNPEVQAVIYKDTLWKCYMKRISGKLE
ncbi:unnamed protein product, partial [Iphiclides podalirius]